MVAVCTRNAGFAPEFVCGMRLRRLYRSPSQAVVAAQRRIRVSRPLPQSCGAKPMTRRLAASYRRRRTPLAVASDDDDRATRHIPKQPTARPGGASSRRLASADGVCWRPRAGDCLSPGVASRRRQRRSNSKTPNDFCLLSPKTRNATHRDRRQGGVARNSASATRRSRRVRRRLRLAPEGANKNALAPLATLATLADSQKSAVRSKETPSCRLHGYTTEVADR
jgi:hypothetical protein